MKQCHTDMKNVKQVKQEAVHEIVAGEFLDAVFEHIADDQRHEERHGEVAVFLLEGKGDGGGENHGDAGGDAEGDLFRHGAVFFTVGIQEQVVLHVGLQHAQAVESGAVAVGTVFFDHRPAAGTAVGDFLAAGR